MQMSGNWSSNNIIDLERVATENENLNSEKISNIFTGVCHWTRACPLYLKTVTK